MAVYFEYNSYLFFLYVLLTVHLSIFILTLILLTWRIWWAPNNANKRQMGFNSAFKGLIINQLDAQNLFYNKFISCLYMFRALCAHRQEVKIVLYSIWYHHTCRWPSRARVERGHAHRTATYRCGDTRCCIIQFWPPDDEQMVLETCRGMK